MKLSQHRVAIDAINDIPDSDPAMVRLSLRDATQTQSMTRRARVPDPGMGGGAGYARAVPKPDEPFVPGEIMTIVLHRGELDEEETDI